MPQSYSFAQLTKAFAAVYHVVEARAVIVRDEGEWVPLCVGIRFGARPRSEQYGPDALSISPADMRSDSLRLIEQRYEDIQHLLSEITRGCLTLSPDISVAIPSSILDREASADEEKRTFRASGRVPGLRPLRGPHPLNDRQLQKDVERAAFATVAELVKEFNGCDIGEGDSGIGVLLEAEAPVWLDELKAIRKGRESTLRLSVFAHRTIEANDLQVNIRQRRQNDTVRIRRRVSIEQRHGACDGEYVEYQASVILEDVSETKPLEIDFFCEPVGRVIFYNKWLRQCLPPNEVISLETALRKYVPTEDLERMLYDPASLSQRLCNVSLSKSQQILEIGVQTLLSLLGFNAIWLHAYDKRNKGDLTQDAVDCLAYHAHDRLLLIVHCSLKAPLPKEIRDAESVHERFRQEFFADTSINIQSAFFIADNKTNVSTSGPVQIFFKSDMEALLLAAHAPEPFSYMQWTTRSFFTG